MGDGRLTEAAWEIEQAVKSRADFRDEAAAMDRLWRESRDSAILGRIDFALAGRYGEEGRQALQTNPTAKAIHQCAVLFIHDLLKRR
jgi:hypothetical protein